MRQQALAVAPWLALLSLWSFSSPPSDATCVGAKPFGQLSPENGYNYVLFPSDAEVASGSILGRFWTPGARAGANEGTCVASDWLVPCDPAVYPCGGGEAGRSFYLDGFLSSGTCVTTGCVTGEMITLIETTSVRQDTAYFAVGRVDETPWLSLAFDDSRIGRDWVLREIPRPVVTGAAARTTSSRFITSPRGTNSTSTRGTTAVRCRRACSGIIRRT